MSPRLWGRYPAAMLTRLLTLRMRVSILDPMLTDDQYSSVLRGLSAPLKLLARDDVRSFLEALDSPGQKAGRYRTWREGRFHEPKPEGLSLEQLQALWRYDREQRSISIGLLAFEEQPMRVNLSRPTLRAIQEVALFEALGADHQVTQPSLDESDQYRYYSLIEEAFASSLIEGAMTSRRVAKDLARSKRAPKNASEHMILNNWRALNRIPEWQEQPLSSALLCEIQALITENTDLGKEDVGSLRTEDDIVVFDRRSNEVIHQPPPASELPERMLRLSRFAAEDQGLAPLLRAILVHHQIAFDHPFRDGNGRTARVAFLLEATRDSKLNWLQLVPFSRAIAKDKAAYYQSFVDTASEGWDTTHFVRSQLRYLAIECERLANFLTDEVRQRAKYSSKLHLESKLNARQMTLIRSALRSSHAFFTQVEHAQYHQVTTMTAQRDLTQLVKWRLLLKRKDPKDGRRYLYWATKRLGDLAEEG